MELYGWFQNLRESTKKRIASVVKHGARPHQIEFSHFFIRSDFENISNQPRFELELSVVIQEEDLTQAGTFMYFMVTEIHYLTTICPYVCIVFHTRTYLGMYVFTFICCHNSTRRFEAESGFSVLSLFLFLLLMSKCIHFFLYYSKFPIISAVPISYTFI